MKRKITDSLEYSCRLVLKKEEMTKLLNSRSSAIS